MVRNFTETFPSLKEYVLDPLKPDVFIVGHPNKYGLVQNQEDLIKRYNPTKIIFQHYRIEDNTEWENPAYPGEQAHLRPFFAQHKNLLAVSQLMQLYEFTSRIKYDLVIRLRFDYFFTRSFSPTELDQARQNNTILIPSKWDYKDFVSDAVCDMFAMGNRVTMMKYCSMWPHILDYNKRGVLLHPESMLGYHLNLILLNV